jgi:hypothetical protein
VSCASSPRVRSLSSVSTASGCIRVDIVMKPHLKDASTSINKLRIQNNLAIKNTPVDRNTTAGFVP